MKKFSLSLLAVATLVLTACGGSDNGSTVVSTPISSTSPNTNPNSSTTTDNTGSTSTATAAYTGQAVQLNDRRTVTTAINTNNLNTLVVDGRTYTIGYDNIRSANFNTTKTRDYHSIASGTHMSYAKYGFYEDELTDKEYFYYQGQKTPVSAIPTSGIVNYSGQAVYECDNCGDDPRTGYSALVVDFANKKIEGNIVSAIINLGIEATISGNSFVGTTTEGTTTTGAFFGPNAEEVSGTIVNPKLEFVGSFGATKKFLTTH